MSLPYNTSTEYSGQYRGIHWSIKNWSFSGKAPFDKWNYYINIFLNQIKNQELAKLFWPKDKINDWGVSLDYYSVPIINDIQFHGGVTFFEKKPHIGRKGVEDNYVKVGCDYSHLWDENRIYDLDDLLFDVKRTIDLFHENCEYLIRCRWNGELALESEGEYSPEGSFYSHEGRKAMDEKYPKP